MKTANPTIQGKAKRSPSRSTRPWPGVARISCEGYKYTLSPNTLAVGSAEYMFLMSGFCATEFVANPIKQKRKKYVVFKFMTLFLSMISKLL